MLNSGRPLPSCMCVSGQALDFPKLQLLIFKMGLIIPYKIVISYDNNVKHEVHSPAHNKDSINGNYCFKQNICFYIEWLYG